MKKNIGIKAILASLFLGILFWWFHFHRESQLLEMLRLEASRNSDIEILWNSSVRYELKKLLEPSALKNSEAAFCRYEKLRSTIFGAFEEFHVPKSLVAIAFVETGFRHLNDGANAGVWNLFLQTAQVYGLVVDANRDERKDLVKSSKVAAQYLSVTNQMLHDWNLTILAYSIGETAVLEAKRNNPIASAESLESRLSPKNPYLSKVMAAIILMNSGKLSCARN